MLVSRLAGRWLAAVVLLVGAVAPPRVAHAQITNCISCGVPYSVDVTPDGATSTVNTGVTDTAAFTVRNNGDNSNTYSFECFATGVLVCGTITPPSASLGTFTETTVKVAYTKTGVGSGTLTLEADGTQAVDVGSYNITVVAPPAVTLVVPTLTSGSRAVVRTRQPLILGRMTPAAGWLIDTTKTVLSWRGVNVTKSSRNNRGLIEWEVDSTQRLAVGDSGLVSLKVCGTNNGCVTVTRWAVLLNDQKPVLGFTGMPLEALGSQFSSSFGPGLSVSGADVETAFGTVPYFSMGAPRSFGMSYSTRQSYPRALVPVDLELPWPAGTPDQIKLVLIDGATRLDSLVLASPTCATGALKRCRAVLQGDFSASTFSSPTRKWLTVEASVTSGATTQMGSDSVEVVLVDRRQTRYGSGWWPSTFQQIVQAGQDRLLITPTGTAAVFRGNGDSLYISPPGSATRLVKVGTTWELRPRGTTAKLVFDASGRLRASVDANGNRDSLAYSGSTDQITSVVDPIGQPIALTYNGSAKLQTITDPMGRQTKITINGTTNQLTYDSLSSPTTQGASTSYVYRTYPGTQTVVLLKRIGVILDTTIVTYDSAFRRRPTKVRLPLVQDETGAAVTPQIRYTAYASQGYGTLRSLDSVYAELKDPRNNWTRSLLNRWAQGRLTWDSVGVLSRSQYDADGFLQWTEGKVADSSRVYEAYDASKRLAKTYIIRAVGDTLRVDSLVYDGNDRIIQRIDSRGQANSVTYDANGNVLTASDPAGNVTRTWYKTTGLPDSTRAPGNTVSKRFTYDATWKQLAIVVDETGDTVGSTTYDSYGRPSVMQRKVRVQASSGSPDNMQWRQVTKAYRIDNAVTSQVLQRTDNCAAPCATPTWLPTSDTLHTETIQHTYDRAGRDSVRQNDRLIKTVYVYDRLARLTSRRPWSDSSAVKDSMVYDIGSNLVKSLNRRGDVITIAYDSRNRDTSAVLPGIGTRKKVYGGPLDELTRVYDASPVDSIGAVTTELRWGYDNRGRLKADTSYAGGTVRATAYTYDSFERPSTLVDPLGTWTTRYETSQRGLPTTLVTPFADSLVYSYDAQGRALGPTVMSSGPSVATTLSWIEDGSLDTLRTKVNTATSYIAGEYDRSLNMPGDPVPLNPRWVEQAGSGAAVVTRIDSTTYDGRERVTRWVAMKNNTVLSTESMQYDRTGNAMTSDAEVYDIVTDRLRERTTSSKWIQYTYDRAGNQVQHRDSVLSSGAIITYTFGYDALNQLRSVRRGSTVIARYAYDVSGRRIAQRVYSTLTGGTLAYTRFVYHGDAVGFETDSSGSIGLRYTWGSGTDVLVGIRDNTGNQYYTVRDKLGSIRGLVKRDGTWVLNFAYNPWGDVVDSSGTQFNLLRYRWAGREFDAETGNYFLRSRYYSAAQHRFIQEDPVGFSGGTNLYTYVGGHLLEAVDPDGTMYRDVNGGPGGGGGGVHMRNDMGMGDRGRDWWAGFLDGPDFLILSVYVDGQYVGTASDDWGDGSHWQFHQDISRPSGEPMNREEAQRYRSLCQGGGCSDIRFHFTRGENGLALGREIFLPKNFNRKNPDDEERGLMAHEIFHYVGQYLEWGAFKYYFSAIMTQVVQRTMLRENVYDWVTPWGNGVPFTALGMEQAAEAVGACFRGYDVACAYTGYWR